MFVIGRDYTRTEIHAQLGGSKVSCLPTRNGAIVAACLTAEFSPDAPRVVLCGQGPRTGPVSAMLARYRGPVPVFMKQGASRWQFRGAFKVTGSLVAGARFESLIQGSGRAIDSVSVVVLLEPTA